VDGTPTRDGCVRNAQHYHVRALVGKLLNVQYHVRVRGRDGEADQDQKRMGSPQDTNGIADDVLGDGCRDVWDGLWNMLHGRLGILGFH
jgi:hypothetical protein